MLPSRQVDVCCVCVFVWRFSHSFVEIVIIKRFNRLLMKQLLVNVCANKKKTPLKLVGNRLLCKIFLWNFLSEHTVIINWYHQKTNNLSDHTSFYIFWEMKDLFVWLHLRNLTHLCRKVKMWYRSSLNVCKLNININLFPIQYFIRHNNALFFIKNQKCVSVQRILKP